MQVSGPARGPSCEWRKAILGAVVFVSVGAVAAQGQDVAEASRQAKTQKAAEQKSAKHVYTEEDLKRSVILTPEDQTRVEARKRQQNNPPAQQNAEQKPNNDAPFTESLGEIARRYRQEKAAQEAELAAKKKFAPFIYKAPESVLADPAPGVDPVMRNGASVIPFQPRAPHVPVSSAAGRARLSPFLPRPLRGVPPAPSIGLAVASVRPAEPAPVVRPAETVSLAAPLKAGTQRIEVKRGQSWWKLAEHYLGDGSRWQELRALNASAGGPSELLKLGSVIVVPEVQAPKKGATQGTIRVAKGDSLWSLARQYFGHGTEWNCLAAANPQIADYNHLAVGTALRVPDEEARRFCQNTIAVRK